jgi:hypothetical protein
MAEVPTEYDTGPELLRVEPMDNFICQAPNQSNGKRYLFFGGLPFPSLPHVHIGLCLKPETTQQEAEALAKLINKHCPAPFAQFFDRSLTDEYPELDVHGLAKLEQGFGR